MGSITRLKSALSVVAAAAMLGAAALPLAAQATGTVRGRVTDAATQRPLSGAQITVTGTGRRAVSNSTGEYTLANVPAGTVAIRAELLGYGASTQSVNVAAGQTATANFALSTRSIALDALVVTGTPGAQQRRELGNAVTQVNAAEVAEKTPITSVSQLLQARSPGLTITSGSGTAGTAANISIRGLNSLNGRNRPLIFVDGVRMNTGAYDIGSGGQDFDVLQNIDPNDIESVEVIKGPAASTLYGSEAAAGVIQIITKKGKVGDQQVQFSVKGDLGRTDWNLWMPDNYWTCSNAAVRNGNLPPPAYTPQTGAAYNWYVGCANVDTLSSDPTARIISGNALRDYIVDGEIRSLDVSARGGGERYSFFVSGDRNEEDGIFPTEFSDRTTLRGNFFVQPRDNMDLALSMSLSRTDRGLPENDNNSWGYLRNAYRGYPGILLASGWNEVGWRGLSPVVIDEVENTFKTDQLIISTTANWQPVSWFRNRFTVGADISDKNNTSFYARDQTGRRPYGTTTAPGYISHWRPEDRDYTLDYAGTVSFELPREISSDLSFGMQYTQERYHSFQSVGIGLAFRPVRIVDAAEDTYAYESFTEQKNLGVFLQQQLGWKDRLFVTGAVRADDNSAFGTDFDYELYPKLSASYVISEEPFFNFPAVSELKLRGAWGRAGSSPSPFAADRTYASNSVLLSNDAVATGVVPASFGNPDLRAELGSELELGFDASLFNDRVSLETTYYNQSTDDLLLTIPVAPSSGFSGGQQLNVGELSNSGWEFAVNATPVQSPKLRWESRLSLSTNSNELVSFNGARDEPIRRGYGGGTQLIAEGYPVAGYWAYEVERDANGTPILDENGIAILTDEEVYVGPSQPTREAGFTNTFTILGNLQLYTFLDYKGGHYLYNMTEETRDWDGFTYINHDPDPDPIDYGMRFSGSLLPYIQKADFVRLREVTLTYNVPSSLLGRFGTDALSLSLAGRNLKLWTDYAGSDPEVNIEGVDDFVRGDYMSLPSRRQIVATVNVRF